MKDNSKGSGLPSLLIIFVPIVFLYDSFSLQSGWIICGYQMGIIFVKSTFFNHLSAGDEIGSTAPIMYAYILNDGSTRGKLQFLLITLGGIRLSYNLGRKGGYRGLEDYRWLAVKNRMQNPVVGQLFRVLFICGYQMVINFQLVLPVYYQNSAPVNAFDYFLTALGLFFIGYQMIADQQQWDFQERKKAGKSPEKEIGFVKTGLGKYCRHPNYFAELGLWWSVFAFNLQFNWAIAGVLTMTLLFQRVIKLTEKFSRSKYPEFANYQETTSKLIPWPVKEIKKE